MPVDLDSITLSVVVPTYNEGERVVRCIERLALCEGIGEVILVDASDDPASLEIVNGLDGDSDASIRLLRGPERGRSRQMNYGAEFATGDSIMFLHCDTEIPVDTVGKVADCLEKNHWGRFDVILDAPGWGFRLIETMMNIRSRATNLATGDQGIFARLDWFKNQGMFADMSLMEDIEFSNRVGRSFPPGIARAKVKTSARRWQKNGVWRTIFLMWKLRFMYRMGTHPDKLAAMYFHAR